MTEETAIRAAAEAIGQADALLIGAGAGMGVDSGLPDFRGDRGFWNAYPPYEQLGLNFIALANPRWFEDDPELAWGFYGHRLNLYRATVPHQGFGILLRWGQRMKQGAFVYTSNVDGQFQKAGFPEEQIVEVHGTVEWMQCTRPGCRSSPWAIPPNPTQPLVIDELCLRAIPPLPACPECRSLARPNVLMFGDSHWKEERSWEQEQRFNQWLGGLQGCRLAVVECGAGTAIPTVRQMCEHASRRWDGRLIRLNVREAQVPAGEIGLALGALEGLKRIDTLLASG